jgi:hypothetical protein
MEIFDQGADESTSPRSRRRSLAKRGERRAAQSGGGVHPLGGPERAPGFQRLIPGGVKMMPPASADREAGP